ncbi:MAG: hypothetical protein ACMXYE_00165 [Candidatus Woesearchaeota archaeon]
MKISARMRKKIRLYGFYVSLVLFLLGALMLFGVSPMKLFVISFLILLGCISRLYKHFVGISIGFELVTPITIVLAYTTDFFFALIAGQFMFLVSTLLSGRLNAVAMVVQMSVYAVITLLTVLFSAVPFVTLAVFLVFVRNIVLWLMMVMLFGVDFFKATLATLPNIIINSFIVGTAGIFFVNVLV